MSYLGNKVPVEPLEDRRYARVEDKLVASFQAMAAARAAERAGRPSLGDALAALGRAFRRAAPAVAVAAVAAAVFFALRAGRDPGPYEPARITSGPDGGSTLDLGDAVCTITAATTVDLARPPGPRGRAGIDLSLVRGRIDCEVEPRPARAAVIVHAGDVAVTVVGTLFRVERDHVVHVSVSRGKVRVDVAGKSLYVNAGESWSGPALLAAGDPADAPASGSAGAASAHADGPDTSAASAASAASTAASAASTGSSATDRPDDSDSSATAGTGSARSDDARTLRRPDDDDGSRPDSDRVAFDVDRGGGLQGQHTPREPRVDDPAHTGKKTRSENDRRSVLRKARPGRGQAPAAASAALAAILELETRDPEEAVRRYGEIALRRGPEAEFALYSLAYVQYFRLDDHAAALQSLERYQRRFTDGAHRESALWLRVRVLCAGSDREACRVAAHSYLARFPQGQHARVAREIINWDM